VADTLTRRSQKLPTIRADRRGYFYDGETVEGFLDRPELDEAARTVIARFARAYAPETLADEQRSLFNRSEGRRLEASALLRAFAEDEVDVEEAFAAGFYDDLSEKEREIVRDPTSHAQIRRGYPLTIGDVATVTGATPDQLRHWEANDLLTTYRVNGQRKYFRGGLVRAIVLAKSEQYELATLTKVIHESSDRFIRLLAATISAAPDDERLRRTGREFVCLGKALLERSGEPTAWHELLTTPKQPLVKSRSAKAGTFGASGASRRSTKSKRLAVQPAPGGGWEIVEEWPSAHMRTKYEAIKCARSLAASSGVAEVAIHGGDGRLIKRADVKVASPRSRR
jgi:hypothetical protein